MHENDSTLLLRVTPELLEGWWFTLPSYFEAFGDDHGIYLDLARAECRDRVVRWLALQIGVAGSVSWSYSRAWLGWRLVWPADNGCHFAYWSHAAHLKYWQRPECKGYPEALATLDPADDTRLPDGSRLVDALALRMVAEHVLKP